MRSSRMDAVSADVPRTNSFLLPYFIQGSFRRKDECLLLAARTDDVVDRERALKADVAAHRGAILDALLASCLANCPDRRTEETAILNLWGYER